MKYENGDLLSLLTLISNSFYQTPVSRSLRLIILASPNGRQADEPALRLVAQLKNAAEIVSIWLVISPRFFRFVRFKVYAIA